MGKITHDDWSPKAQAVLDELMEDDFLEPFIRWGPGHIVFDDGNLTDHSIDFCIAACSDIERYKEQFPECDCEDQIEAYCSWIREALEELKAIPENERSTTLSDERDGYPHEHHDRY